jgi:hypothetical protein
MSTNNKNCTRYYSDIQEKRTAKNLGGEVQVSSGSGAFRKGDVITDDFFIECKTNETEKKSVSIKREWLEKMNEQRREMRKRYAALAFDFGSDENYYVIDEKTMKLLINYIKKENEETEEE